MLNPDSPMPLYRQLADELSERIRAGVYTPGSRIPSEHELASKYALGRPTVRQATEVLVRKRVLERRRGSGTFVANAVPEVDLFSLGGTLASDPFGGILRILQGVNDGSGMVDIHLTMPQAGLPSGFEFLFQSWIEDRGGPQGFSATNGLQAFTP